MGIVEFKILWQLYNIRVFIFVTLFTLFSFTLLNNISIIKYKIYTFWI